VEVVAVSEAFLSQNWHRVSKLKPRLRGHVQVHRHRYRGQAWYVVQDDVAGRFHRFTPAVYQFVGWMDGHRSVDELWSGVVTQLGDDAPTQDEVIRLLSQLHGADLLQCDVPPDASELFNRYASHVRRSLRGRFGNPMSIRFPLWDPNRFLDRTVHLVRPLFGKAGALVWFAVVLPALVLAAVHWPELIGNVTDRVLATENLVLMAMVFPVLKLLHELGHGYATKVHDGEVHELGLMFIVFAPVPYADASASAAFRSKWQRALVGAAGMLVEFFVAALAMFVWTLSEPGMVRSVAYNVMLIAGVSTFVFNANPLLRFDGYYILADLIEIPNLGARANRYWAWLVQHRLFGVEAEPQHATAGERAWFLFYAPAAFIYRMTVMFGIALFVASQFFFVGVMAAIWGVFVGLVWPVMKAASFVVSSPRLQRHRKRAVAVTFGGAAALAGLLLLVPAPLHTNAEGVVWLPDDSFVRASTESFVKRVLARPGQHVEIGTPLIESEEPGLSSEVRVLKAQLDATNIRLASEQFDDRVQADLTRRELEIRTAKLGRAREQVDQLVVRAGAAGTLVIPRAEDLPGRFYKRGEVIGYVTAPEAQIVRAVVTQDDIELVRLRTVGVEIKLPGRLGETFHSKVLREVPAGSDRLPSKALTEAGGGRLAVDPKDESQTKTLQRTFQLDLSLPRSASALFGSRVLVRFDHGSEPLGWQWYRRIRQLFLARFNA
jgi:putative peptide zinc metalloprotease protein